MRGMSLSSRSQTHRRSFRRTDCPRWCSGNMLSLLASSWFAIHIDSQNYL